MNTTWRNRPEAGGHFALRVARWLIFNLGRTAVLVLSWPVALYFMLRRGPERRASRAFLTRLLGRPARLVDVLRNFHYFTCTTVDRFYLLAGQFWRFELECTGIDLLHDALNEGRGVLMVSAHLGSFDALRVLALQRPEVGIRILLDIEQNPGISALLNELNPALAATVLNARQSGPSLALAMKEALDDNCIVATLGDRLRPGNSPVEVDFLGAATSLPAAPWQMAGVLKVPLIAAFGLFRGGKRYEIHFERLEVPQQFERRDRARNVANMAQRFADRLAHYAGIAPYNWFNF
ncbi:MAG: hypothetical protein KDI32_02590, partial [Pseudomonadales bacterium]|nr:hypothetical protein [Pseudomonadales bacterium]